MGVQQFVGRPSVQTTARDERAHREQIARAVNNAMRGHLNCTLQLTLDAGVTTTTITDERISAQTFLGLMPTTANAAAAVATTYVVPSNGAAVVHHANNAQTDRVFVVSLIG